jgi:tetratricopeptide (TPR) repeat protein
MTAFQGEIVTFIGPLDAVSRGPARRAVMAAGGDVRRGLTRGTTICVVGHGALCRIRRLEERLDTAEIIGATLVSENAFLRRAGMIPAVTSDQHPFDAAEIASRSGIAPEHLRLLVLFDIVEPSDGRFGLRDLLFVRSICTLLRGGLSITDVLRELACARTALDRLPPNLFGDEAGRVAVRLGETVSELGGQLRLPLAAADDFSVDELFEQAEEAEDLGDWSKAERLYRRHLDRDRKDPTAAYNLGNMLYRLGREHDARLWLQHAVGLDPSFAEGWYNLSLIARASGNRQAACRHLEQALAADPTFADAMFNLAVLRFEFGEHAAAEALWRRYLQHDARSEWARKARCGLALCRQLTSAGKAQPVPEMGQVPAFRTTMHPIPRRR